MEIYEERVLGCDPKLIQGDSIVMDRYAILFSSDVKEESNISFSIKNNTLIARSNNDEHKFGLLSHVDFDIFMKHVLSEMYFGRSSAIEIPSNIRSKIDEELITRLEELSPDCTFINNGIIHTIEIETSINDIEFIPLSLINAKKYGAITKHNFLRYTSISITRRSMTINGINLSFTLLRQLYASWMGLRKILSDHFGLKCYDIKLSIPNIPLLDFGRCPLNYDKSWIESFETIKPMMPTQYGYFEPKKFVKPPKLIHDDYEQFAVLPTYEKLSEMPLILPSSSNLPIPDYFEKTGDRRRDSFLKTISLTQCHKRIIYIEKPKDQTEDKLDILRGKNARKYTADYTGSVFSNCKRKNNLDETYCPKIYNFCEHTFEENSISSELFRKAKRDHLRTLLPMDLDLEGISDWLKGDAKYYVELDLAEKTFPNHLYPEDYGEFLYKRTRLVQYMAFLQRLVEELNIIRKSAMTNSQEKYWVSKVGDYDVYVLAQSSGADKHLFYDLLFHGDIMVGFTGNPYYKVGDDWFISYHVLSVNPERIEQLMNSLYCILSLAQFYQRFPEDSFTYLTVSFLVIMDGKQKTIDMLQQFRYIYMKQTSLYNDTQLCIQKMSGAIRTRLQSFILYRAIKIMNNRAEIKCNEEGNIKIDNLINWITMKEIKSIEEMVTLSYMHYSTKSKSNNTMHGITKCLKKIIEEEIKLDDIDVEEIKNPNFKFLRRKKISHEYSRPFIKELGQFCCRKVLNSISSVDGMMEDFLDEIEPEMRFEKFATMKKSTVCVKGRFIRKTCAEALTMVQNKIKFSKNAVNSMYNLQTSLLDLEGRAVTVFKKDQQTGIREIFVMPIQMRICVAFCELFFKRIGVCMGNEMISQPDERELFDSKHRSKVHYQLTKNKVSETVEMTSSSDAKTWCQRWIMPTFCDFSNALIDGLLKNSIIHKDTLSNIRNIIFNTMNAITNKRIFPDERVLLTAARTPEDHIFDDFYSTLKDISKGCSRLNYGEGWRSFRNMSNMMQGVPHILSSVIHSSYMIRTSMYMRGVVKNLNLKDKIAFCVISTEVSSDDSSTLLTLGLKGETTERTKKELNLILGRVLYMIEDMKTEMGACSSEEKTVVATLGKLKEFNSCWSAGVSIYFASIKYVTSLLTMGYHPVLKDRVSEALSSLTQLYKEGLYTKEIGVINKCLQLIHGRNLLMIEDPWFKRLLTTKSPMLGVVPYLPPSLVGFLNLEHIRLLYRSLYNGDDKLEWNQNSLPGLTIDKNYKYQNFVKNLGADRSLLVKKANLQDKIDFIMNGFNDFTSNIQIKALSPGVALSLSRPGLIKIHAASAYTGTCNVVSCYKEDDQEENKKKTMHDLIHDFESTKRNMVELTPSQLRMIEDLKVLAPNDKLDLELEEKSKAKQNYRRKRITVRMNRFRRFGSNIKLIIRKAWLNLELGIVEQNYIDEVKFSEPRFSRNLTECIENFGDIITVRNWFMSLKNDSNKVRLILPSKFSDDRLLMLGTNLHYNYDKFVSLNITSLSHDLNFETVENEFEESQFSIIKRVISRFMHVIVNPFSCVRDMIPHLGNKMNKNEKLHVRDWFIVKDNVPFIDVTNTIWMYILNKFVYKEDMKFCSIDFDVLPVETKLIFIQVPLLQEYLLDYSYLLKYKRLGFHIHWPQKLKFIHMQLWVLENYNKSESLCYYQFKERLLLIDKFINMMKEFVGLELTYAFSTTLLWDNKTCLIRGNIMDYISNSAILPISIGEYKLEYVGKQETLDKYTIITYERRSEIVIKGPQMCVRDNHIVMPYQMINYQGTRDLKFHLVDFLGNRLMTTDLCEAKFALRDVSRMIKPREQITMRNMYMKKPKMEKFNFDQNLCVNDPRFQINYLTARDIIKPTRITENDFRLVKVENPDPNIIIAGRLGDDSLMGVKKLRLSDLEREYDLEVNKGFIESIISFLINIEVEDNDKWELLAFMTNCLHYPEAKKAFFKNRHIREILSYRPICMEEELDKTKKETLNCEEQIEKLKFILGTDFTSEDEEFLRTADEMRRAMEESDKRNSSQTEYKDPKAIRQDLDKCLDMLEEGELFDESVADTGSIGDITDLFGRTDDINSIAITNFETNLLSHYFGDELLDKRQLTNLDIIEKRNELSKIKVFKGSCLNDKLKVFEHVFGKMFQWAMRFLDDMVKDYNKNYGIPNNRTIIQFLKGNKNLDIDLLGEANSMSTSYLDCDERGENND